MDQNVKRVPVEIYLPATIFRGNLTLKHKRLSDYMNAKMCEGMLRLDDVEIQTFSGKSSPIKSKSAFVYKRQVTFLIDLSSTPSTTGESEELSKVNKKARRVLMEVGSFWLQGDVHLVPSLELDSFADGNASFIPLTTATFVDSRGSQPRTFLINRKKVHSLMSMTDALPISAYPALARKK